MEFKKSDLKSGVHSVVFRNGKRGQVDGDRLIASNGIWATLPNFNENLKNKDNKDWDIIEVLELKPLWQREEKEMIEIDGVEYEKGWVKGCIDLVLLGEKEKEAPKEEPKPAETIDLNNGKISLDHTKPYPGMEEPKEEKKKFVIEYEKNKTYALATCSIFDKVEVGITNTFKNRGRYRKTEQNAKYSQKRNQIANRLEALVEELQGELGVGEYTIYIANGAYKTEHSTYFNIGDILMTEETAIKICEMLNNEEYDLEG